PITSLLMAMGGAVGLKDFLKSTRIKKKNLKRNLYLGAGITIGLCLLAWFITYSYGFQSPGDASLIQRLSRALKAKVSIEPILQTRAALLSKDAWRSIILILLASGALWLNLRDKIKSRVLLAIIAVLVLFDIWGIG